MRHNPPVTIVWFRNDLRVHDHPALAVAAAARSLVIPVFILDDRLLAGRFASPSRTKFLLECLADLRTVLAARGADLVIRRGQPAAELTKLAQATGATTVLATQDVTPYATRRDQAVAQALAAHGITLQLHPGRLAVEDFAAFTTAGGRPYQVFTPFHRRWLQAPRRPLAPAPDCLTLPPGLDPGPLPAQPQLTPGQPAPHALPGGESAGRTRLDDWLAHGIHAYHLHHDDLAADATSRLSAYLHFGAVSVREIEESLPPGEGPAAFHRQLAWRDFYHYVLHQFPDNRHQEFQARYRDLPWVYDESFLEAWQTGRTGYPIVDAAMRQLLAGGWMHNRARLIVGSFLTKDLGLDWRLGEQHFMRHLIDGDEANNNGNWQWIASVGVDPAPVFRRLYNPTKQQATYDATGDYVRRYLPELGTPDYPAPIVDHAAARQAALERYRR